MRYFVHLDDSDFEIEVRDARSGPQAFLVEDGQTAGSPVPLERTETPEGFVARTTAGVLDAVIVERDGTLVVGIEGATLAARVQTAHERELVRGAKSSLSSGTVNSPMPGKVLRVFVSEGEQVETGARLAVIEAMKMENELTAETAGTVRKVLVQPGDAIEGGAAVLELEASAGEQG